VTLPDFQQGCAPSFQHLQQRLDAVFRTTSWSEIALHARGLSGYPSSHGCIHLPYSFAKKLFTVTQKGCVTIFVSGKHEKVEVFRGCVLIGSAPLKLRDPSFKLPTAVPLRLEDKVETKTNKKAGDSATPVVTSPEEMTVETRTDGDFHIMNAGKSSAPATKKTK
jgi:hypothetical protein